MVPADSGLGDQPGATLARSATLHPPQLDSRQPLWTESMSPDRLGDAKFLPSLS